MKVLRSILAVVVGWIVSAVVMTAIHFLSVVIHLPPGENSALEMMKRLSEDSEAMKAWLNAAPASAMFSVLAAWQAGAFIGGLVCALIAGRARVLHAAIIGILVLFGTIANFFDMKSKYDFTHPDWMIVAGLLLPIPISLVAGKLVSYFLPPPGNTP